MTPPAARRRLLVLVHEFPPAGGGGVQRIAKFCKYLPEFGWEPEVITTSLIEGRPTDSSLLVDVGETPVVRLPHRDVATFVARGFAPLKRLVRSGRRSSTAGTPRAGTVGHHVGPHATPGLVSAAPTSKPLSARVASWVSVPDSAACWAHSATRLGSSSEYSGIDAVLASGPPHSTLVAGARIASAQGVPFFVDFRDAWAEYPGRSTPTSFHRSKSESLEREVMERAAVVVAASEPFADEASRYGAKSAVTITNGYDPDDLPPRPAERSVREGLALAFMGRFYASTDPSALFRGIAAARDGGLQVTLDVVGPDAPDAQRLAEQLGVGDAVRFLGYMAHREALETVIRADVAAVTLASIPGTSGIYPGKLFEYLGMGLPVLLVGPTQGVSARLIESAGAGEVVSPDDIAGIAAALGRLARAAANGSLARPDAGVIARFQRRTLTAELAKILDSAIGVHGE